MQSSGRASDARKIFENEDEAHLIYTLGVLNMGVKNDLLKKSVFDKVITSKEVKESDLYMRLISLWSNPSATDRRITRGMDTFECIKELLNLPEHIDGFRCNPVPPATITKVDESLQVCTLNSHGESADSDYFDIPEHLHIIVPHHYGVEVGYTTPPPPDDKTLEEILEDGIATTTDYYMYTPTSRMRNIVLTPFSAKDSAGRKISNVRRSGVAKEHTDESSQILMKKCVDTWADESEEDCKSCKIKASSSIPPHNIIKWKNKDAVEKIKVCKRTTLREVVETHFEGLKKPTILVVFSCNFSRDEGNTTVYLKADRLGLDTIIERKMNEIASHNRQVENQSFFLDFAEKWKGMLRSNFVKTMGECVTTTFQRCSSASANILPIDMTQKTSPVDFESDNLWNYVFPLSSDHSFESIEKARNRTLNMDLCNTVHATAFVEMWTAHNFCYKLYQKHCPNLSGRDLQDCLEDVLHTIPDTDQEHPKIKHCATKVSQSNDEVSEIAEIDSESTGNDESEEPTTQDEKFTEESLSTIKTFLKKTIPRFMRLDQIRTILVGNELKIDEFEFLFPKMNSWSASLSFLSIKKSMLLLPRQRVAISRNRSMMKRRKTTSMMKKTPTTMRSGDLTSPSHTPHPPPPPLPPKKKF